MFSQRSSTVMGVLLCFCISSSLGQSKNATSINYKGTKFGVSEKMFTQQRRNEGFVCNDSPDKIGRQCKSLVATYADRKAVTLVRFFNDRFAFASIDFAFSSDETSTAVLAENFSDDSIPRSLEDQYGKPNESTWPEETGLGGKLWKKVWRKDDGSTLTYLRSQIISGELKQNSRSIYLSSGDADKVYESLRKARKPDM